MSQLKVRQPLHDVKNSRHSPNKVVFRPSIHLSFPYASAYSKSTYPGSPNRFPFFRSGIAQSRIKGLKGELFLVQELLSTKEILDPRTESPDFGWYAHPFFSWWG